MEKEIKELLKQVGRPYEMFNEDGTYQGCFYPVQFLYPEKPRYKMRSENDDKNYFYGIKKIRENCQKIDKNELKMGDIIATRYRNELHVAVYWEFGKIIHVFRGHSLQTGRLRIFQNYECYRVK